jgi:hypothetical protein
MQSMYFSVVWALGNVIVKERERERKRERREWERERRQEKGGERYREKEIRRG